MKNSGYLFTLCSLALSLPSIASESFKAPQIKESISTQTGKQVLQGKWSSTKSWTWAYLNNYEVRSIHSSYVVRSITHSKLFKNWNETFYKSILLDPEMSFFRERIKLYLSSLGNVENNEAALIKHFSKLLKDQVPASSIKERINDFLHPKPEQDLFYVMRRFLGENTLEDVQQLVHGGDPFHPTTNSLLGKYLIESKAKAVIRRFRTGADNTGPLDGKARMVVALSESTMPIYQKYFTKINFLIHFHTPRQGTLMTAFNGKIGSYGTLRDKISVYLTQSFGTIMPHLLLSTTEGQRLQQYTDLASKNLEFALKPWNLKGYCPRGYHESCTHWIGNLPIGDQYVSEIKLPGTLDEATGNNLPLIGKFSNKWLDQVNESRELEYNTLYFGNRSLDIPSAYKKYYSINGYNIGDRETFDLLRRVWRTPSRMQLSELLGPEELQANMRGEYANPGWVAVRLTAHVSQERMPVIFYVVDDATQSFDPRFNPYIEPY